MRCDFTMPRGCNIYHPENVAIAIFHLSYMTIFQLESWIADDVVEIYLLVVLYNTAMTILVSIFLMGIYHKRPDRPPPEWLMRISGMKSVDQTPTHASSLSDEDAKQDTQSDHDTSSNPANKVIIYCQLANHSLYNRWMIKPHIVHPPR